MLSRFSSAGGQTLKTYVFKFQPLSAITTSAAVSENAGKTSSPSSHPPEFPPPTSKRDFVNFPRAVLQETAPPVRLGFFPESWFKFMYPKTGYTGPYMLGASIILYALSKEVVVVDHNFAHLLGFIGLCYVIHTKFGDKIAAAYNKQLQAEIDQLDGGQEKEKEYIREGIQQLEGIIKQRPAVNEITKGTIEYVQLQMELEFRKRMQEAYLTVKNKLDCQAELENVERRITQRNLMDYVLGNVMKAVTPDLDKSSMKLCIKDLNELAAKS